MRRHLAATIAVALPLVAATAALAASNPHAERVHLNAADVARAKRAVVRRADLGSGWKGGPVRSGDGSSRCAAFDPDLSAFTITGRADSVFSHARGSGVLAHVEVYASRAQARADFALGAKPPMARCIASDLVAALRSSVGRGTSVKVGSSRFVRLTDVGNAAVAVNIEVTVSAVRDIPTYADVLAFQRGRSIGVLMFTGVGNHVAGQAHLVRLMVARMR